ncbi:MAG: tRNA uridine-5-carboxymethylaminomethyl(34) synthesis GTPase MnmE [Elusimicrobiales bacterium]
MYPTNDTIATIASGPDGVIGIVRISGKDTFKVASSFILPNDFYKEKDNKYYLVKIIDPKTCKTIDRAVILVYHAPKSYTREDMIEIFCHNSPYIVRKILELAIENGSRQAQAGEFTFRAYINGRIDLIQAEAINNLIKSETEKQHEIALRQAEGSLSKKVKKIRSQIIDLISEFEVRIDDSYEEMEDIDKCKFYTKIDELVAVIKKLADTYKNSSIIKDGIKICIIGAPNCGKSTLLNTIIGYERLITSPIPGTTRDVVEIAFDINGFKTVFYDTAGIRETDDPIEKEGIKRAIKTATVSDIILLLRDPLQSDDDYFKIKRILYENISKHTKILEIITKSDTVKERKTDGFYVSSFTGENIKKLLFKITEIKQRINDNIFDEIIVSERHYQCLLKAAQEIEKIKDIHFHHYELVSEHLKNALDAMEEIAGRTFSEEIIKNIFSRFCVGK